MCRAVCGAVVVSVFVVQLLPIKAFRPRVNCLLYDFVMSYVRSYDTKISKYVIYL